MKVIVSAHREILLDVQGDNVVSACRTSVQPVNDVLRNVSGRVNKSSPSIAMLCLGVLSATICTLPRDGTVYVVIFAILKDSYSFVRHH